MFTIRNKNSKIDLWRLIVFSVWKSHCYEVEDRKYVFMLTNCDYGLNIDYKNIRFIVQIKSQSPLKRFAKNVK